MTYRSRSMLRSFALMSLLWTCANAMRPTKKEANSSKRDDLELVVNLEEASSREPLSAVALLTDAALDLGSARKSSFVESARWGIRGVTLGVPLEMGSSTAHGKKDEWQWKRSDFVCLGCMTLFAASLHTFFARKAISDLKCNALLLLIMMACIAVYWALVRYFRGYADAQAWFTGYVLETALTVDDIFIFHIVLTAFSLPSSHMHRALSVAIYAAMFLRLGLIACFSALFHIGYIVNVIVGLLLITGSIVPIFFDTDAVEVKDRAVVRFFKWLLGWRLQDSYGEDAVPIEWSPKGFRFNILFLAICCLLAVDAFSAFDAVGSKTKALGGTYLNISSSFMTVFTIRPLFFVVRNLASYFLLVKYGISLILVFVGTEMIVMKWYPISLFALSTVILVVFFSSVMFSVMLHIVRRHCPDAVPLQICSHKSAQPDEQIASNTAQGHDEEEPKEVD